MRPYIIGLNNPQSSDPRHALYPHDGGSAGHRLWRMVRDVEPVSMEDWLLATQRANLLVETELPRSYRAEARSRAAFLEPMIRARVVILLGSDVAEAFRFEEDPFVWGGPTGRWITVPHPSGRNLFYNDPANRVALGVLMHDILRVCAAEDRLGKSDELTERVL